MDEWDSDPEPLIFDPVTLTAHEQPIIIQPQEDTPEVKEDDILDQHML